MCPSSHFVHFFLRYAAFHHVRSPAIASVPGILRQHTIPSMAGCTVLTQAITTILTGFHYASLVIHSLQYHSVHPLPSFIVLAGSPTWAAFTLRLLIAHSSLISQSIAKLLLHSSGTCVNRSRKITPVPSYVAAIAPDDRGFTGTTFVGARCPHPFSRSSITPAAIQRLATAPLPTSVRQGHASFLPQALLPAGLECSTKKDFVEI